jgi:hypothetical protein
MAIEVQWRDAISYVGRKSPHHLLSDYFIPVVKCVLAS